MKVHAIYKHKSKYKGAATNLNRFPERKSHLIGIIETVILEHHQGTETNINLRTV